MQFWDTGGLRPPMVQDYWQGAVREAFTLLETVPRSGDYCRSTVRLHQVGDVSIANLASYAQVVTRTSSTIRQCADDFFFANLQVAGRCSVEQDGRRIEVGPGNFYLVDTARPYCLDYLEPVQLLSYRLPRSLLMGRIPKARQATAVRVDAAFGLGYLAANLMVSLSKCSEQLDSASSVRACDALVDIISLAVVNSAAGGNCPVMGVREALYGAIGAHVRDNCVDAELSLDKVACRFRVSRRYVQTLFSERGQTFSGMLMDARLDHAQSLLRNSDSKIVSIAMESGFSDASYFGKVFRKKIGSTPSQWRAWNLRGSAI